MFNKKHKKGIADAAKAYEVFGQKQADALEHILEEVRQGKRDMDAVLKELNGNIDSLYDHLQSKEKAKLYTVYTPFDIKNLDQQARLFLAGALLRLTADRTPNEYQQNYFRAVQKYLEIKEPPFGTEPLAVEEIEDIPSQKAILQTVLEYLRLQDGDSYDETELQQEFLDAFSVNAKARKEIVEHVELLYTATGAAGLAEKYGYVPEEDPAELEASTNIEHSSSNATYSKAGIQSVIQLIEDSMLFEGSVDPADMDASHFETGNYFVEFSSLQLCYTKVEKQTGKVSPIGFPDPKDKNKIGDHSSCCRVICGDVGYFVEDGDGPYPGCLMAIDFQRDTMKLSSVKFPVPGESVRSPSKEPGSATKSQYEGYWKLHLSANNRYIILYYYVKRDHIWSKNLNKSSGIVYLVDRADLEKVLVLDLSKYPMCVWDVFGLNDNILFIADPEHLSASSAYPKACKFYWYDPVHDIYTPAFFGMSLEDLACEDEWGDKLTGGMKEQIAIQEARIEGMNCVLRISSENILPSLSYINQTVLFFQIDDTTCTPIWTEGFSYDSGQGSVVLYKNYVVSLKTDFKDSKNNTLTVYRYNGEVVEEIEGCDGYILFNEEDLYKYDESNEQWQKKKIGTDSLSVAGSCI